MFVRNFKQLSKQDSGSLAAGSNNRMQPDIFTRYARENAADAGR